MSDLISQLKTERARRVGIFLSKLARIGHPDLVEDFRAIELIDNTLALLAQTANRTRTPKGGAPEVNDTPAPDGFRLSDEVRLAIKQIKSERFRSSTVYDLLHEKWEDYITPDKKPRIGATLSNLVTAGELTAEKDGQRKVWYRAVALRDVRDFFGDLFTEEGVN